MCRNGKKLKIKIKNIVLVLYFILILFFFTLKVDFGSENADSKKKEEFIK